MSTSAPKRTLGQRIVAGIFGVLAALFLLRALQYGVKWLRHVVEGEANFKVMTMWCVVYTLVCAAIAFVVFRIPRGDRG